MTVDLVIVNSIKDRHNIHNELDEFDIWDESYIYLMQVICLENINEA